MNTTTPCAAPGCQNPAHNGYLCGDCLPTLRDDLAKVPALLEDLEITIAKQDHIADSSNRRSNERPLPLRLHPMEAKRELTLKLAAWTHYTTDNYPFTPQTNAAHLATHLLAHLDTIQRDDRAGTCADEIGYAVITAQRAVDKQTQHTYAGPCIHCTTDLYAHPRKTTVTCPNPTCRTEYIITERRDWLLKQAQHQLLTAAEMSRALPGLIQQKLTGDMIRGLARRGRITKHPPHPTQPRQPLYQVGEVIDALADMAREKTRKTQGKPCIGTTH